MRVNWLLRNISLTLKWFLLGDKRGFMKLYSNSARQYKLRMYINLEGTILSWMLRWSHLELIEKTELGLISRKEKMLPHAWYTLQPLLGCVCDHARVRPRVCNFLCRCCEHVFDWHVVDLLGTAFFPGTMSVYSWWLTANLWSRD